MYDRGSSGSGPPPGPAAFRGRVVGVLAALVALMLLGTRASDLLARWQVNCEGSYVVEALRPDQASSSQSEQVQRLQRVQESLEALPGSSQGCGAEGRMLSRVSAGLAEQEHGDAAAILNRRVAGCPDDRLAWFRLGEAYQGEEHWDSAATAWRQAGAEVPLREMGNRLAERGLWAEASFAYEAVLELRPEDCISVAQAGYAQWRADSDLEGARTRLQRAVELCPDRPETYTTMARVLLDARRYEEAEGWAMLGRSADPASEVPLVFLGLVHLRQDRPAEAVPYLQEALHLRRTSVEAHALLGTAYVALGRPDQGVQELEQAIRQAPARAWLYEALGVAYERLGDLASAAAAYRHALALDPARQSTQTRLLKLQAAP